MTNSNIAIREFEEKYGIAYRSDNMHADLTALISEHYYPKDMVRWTFNQRFMACGHTGFDSSILELDLEY